MNLFCKDSVLDTGLKVAANACGMALAMSNPALTASIMPVALALQAKIDGGSDNTILNGLLQQGITELMGVTSDNPVIKAEIGQCLTLLNFDAVTGKLPTLENATIKGLIDSFMTGAQFGVIKK
jgi:hypothetical protein